MTEIYCHLVPCFQTEVFSFDQTARKERMLRWPSGPKLRCQTGGRLKHNSRKAYRSSDRPWNHNCWIVSSQSSEQRPTCRWTRWIACKHAIFLGHQQNCVWLLIKWSWRVHRRAVRMQGAFHSTFVHKKQETLTGTDPIQLWCWSRDV